MDVTRFVLQWSVVGTKAAFGDKRKVIFGLRFTILFRCGGVSGGAKVALLGHVCHSRLQRVF